jgi:hypothetical protein
LFRVLPTPGITGTVESSPFSRYYWHCSEFSLLPVLLALFRVLPSPGITGTVQSSPFSRYYWHCSEFSLLPVLLALFRVLPTPGITVLALFRVLPSPGITGTVQSSPYSWYYWYCSEVSLLPVLLVLLRVLPTSEFYLLQELLTLFRVVTQPVKLIVVKNSYASIFFSQFIHS